MDKKSSKVKIIILVSLLISAGVVLYNTIDVIPPKSLTYGSMHMIKRRILRYAHLHNQLPKNLKELPKIEGYDNRTTDAWGREILYIVNKDNTVTLISYGKDGIQGGVGDSADMIAIFATKNNNIQWEDELCNWVKDPFRPSSK